METNIHIKGMVCPRCVLVIREGIARLGYRVNKITLGKLTLSERPDDRGIMKIQTFLKEKGFDMISDRQTRIVQQAKQLIGQAISETARYDMRVKFPALLSERLNMNYDSISGIFRELEGITMEKYIIAKRLDKVKELLVYTDLTLTQIATVTGFSSINHLSRQFKELTGLTPTHFKSIGSFRRTLTNEDPEDRP